MESSNFPLKIRNNSLKWTSRINSIAPIYNLFIKATKEVRQKILIIFMRLNPSGMKGWQKPFLIFSNPPTGKERPYWYLRGMAMWFLVLEFQNAFTEEPPFLIKPLS